LIATAKERPMPWFSVIYPNRPGATFDFDYYRRHHVPMAAARLGYNMEMRRGISAPDGSPPPYLCIARIWVADAQAFLARIAPFVDELNADRRNYTNIEPVTQFDVPIE
jgi:uncharacterized protein (TIGR02118 family)